jgi:ABC-type multidrug transport system fused ATPase/permease subunit
MSYRPGLPHVLKGFSLDVAAGEKIGVVGRTGAGKSSLMLALFRTTELESGSIEIDELNIRSIGLDRLRRAISIIPQDAILFEGTIRTNLDPFNEYDDHSLWDALSRSGLNKKRDPSKEQKDKYGLDSVIQAEGVNLSVGERNLVSLARALVKNSKIIVLDEATAC